MDKVEDTVGRLEKLLSPDAEMLSYGYRLSEIIKLNPADLIQSQQALIEEMREALEFYTGIHEPALSRPSEGPWGVNSTDFGERARNVLEALSQS